MSTEYLTTTELAGRLKYDERTIREKLMDSVLLEGVHNFASIWASKDSFHLESH